MRSQRQKKLATAALEQSVAAGAGNALEGFGIVTLASLFPVLSVSLLGIVNSLLHSIEEARCAGVHAALGPSLPCCGRLPCCVCCQAAVPCVHRA